MEDHYRCLTCYEELTEDEYCQHKAQGHVTVEYVLLQQKDSKEE